MAIYRGAGGAGDATGDSASEALLVRELAAEVALDAAAAEAARAAAVAAKNAAELAETNAETAETNAETAETNAETAATAAASSASAASTSATNAANSATAAQTAETNAETAETNAETAQAAAASSASAAATSASNAASSANAASTSATNSANSATASASSATTATTQATNAANSATAAATSATNAANSATSASTSASTATTQAGIATTQATNASNSASAAATSATNASSSASAAATSATNASNSASAASTSATNASNSATAAATSATNAANSATAASGFADDASDSADAAAVSAASINLASIAITGGSINGTTIGASTASTGAFTSLTDSGNLTFTGTGNRIRGDFSNATVANRVAFQTSTTNGNTSVTFLPNGTGNISGFQFYNNSDLTNAAFLEVGTRNSGTEARITSGITGTGTYLPMTFVTGGNERLRIDTSGNVGIGTSSPNFSGYGTTNLTISGGTTIQGVLELVGTRADVSGGSAGDINFFANSNSSGNKRIAIIQAITDGATANNRGGAFVVYTKADNGALAERIRVDSSGNLLVGTTTFTGGITSNTGTWRLGGQAPNVDAGFLRHVAGGVTQWQAFGNGNTFNTNGTYGSISDIKLKDNIVDCTPKLEKINQVRIVNYNLKTNSDEKLIGVVAQELEQIFPSMIEETPDYDTDGNALGTTTKLVKYSVFIPMLIKSIQEQQTIINDLKARIETLESK